MTSSICAITPEGRETQLEDSRDGQLYWVGKMKDGKCWMLQNLALGSTSSATPLTPADSNVASNWTLPASYTSAMSGSKSYTAVLSWNFGKRVLATPLLATDCGTSGISSLANCTRVGFVDVSNATNFQPTFTATIGDWNGVTATNNTLVAVNCTSWSGSGISKVCVAGTYDAHYLAGGYYTWNAVTAGTGGMMTSGEASGSICPKGWRLPTNNNATIGSFSGLLNQYGVSSTASGSSYNIAGSPLRFVRGGGVDTGVTLVSTGWYGNYWASTPLSDYVFAHMLIFDGSGVDPSNGNGRSVGLSVRCLAE